MRLTVLLIFLLLCSSYIRNKIVWHNFVIHSFSPNKKYELISIPFQDANKTDGLVVVKERRTEKVLYYFNDKNIQETMFVISDNPSLVYKIDAQIGIERFDPKLSNSMFVYINGIISDTIFNKSNSNCCRIPPSFSYIPQKRLKKEMLHPKSGYETLSYTNDTLKVSSGEYAAYFIFSTGEWIKYEKDGLKNNNYKNLQFKFLTMNSQGRSKLINLLLNSKGE